jgi:hypothetical protein
LALDGVGATKHAFYSNPRKEPWYPLYKRLGGLQVWMGVETRKSVAAMTVKILDQTIENSFTNYTTLSVELLLIITVLTIIILLSNVNEMSVENKIPASSYSSHR